MISVGILTYNGGTVFQRVLRALQAQEMEEEWEVVLLDSGSEDGTPERAEQMCDARVHRIAPEDFSFGTSRDHLFSLCDGEFIVTISQDAVPAHAQWLKAITRPLVDGRADIVQGFETIKEKPFYWDRIGKMYFSSEWRPFREKYGVPYERNGREALMGLSTVCIAMSKDAWQQTRFGPIEMSSDKLFQKRAVEAGLDVELCFEAQVHHGHDYDVRSLVKRCANEGMSLRELGYEVAFPRALRDALRLEMYRKLAGGLVRGEIRSWAEVVFPICRPLAAWYGNRFLDALWR